MAQDNGTIINWLARIYEKLTAGITTTISAGDIEIGAVELKNASTDERATVKAASTAAAATDTSLVVALNPNSPLGAGSAIIGKIGIDQTTPGTTNLVQTKETPDSTSTFTIAPYVSSALEASAVIKASAGNLFSITFTNSNAAIRYLQVFNSTTVPADTAVPTLTFPVQPGSTLAFDTGKFADRYTTGIAICNSTTLASKTLGSADSLFYVKYL